MQADRLLDRVLITELRPDDISFIHDSWATTYRRKAHCRGLKAMHDMDFYSMHRRQRDDILARPGTLVLVARGRERPIWIAAYAVFERLGDDFVAHWVYVRRRQQGLGGRLLVEALNRIGGGLKRLVATHKTDFAPKAQSMGFTFVPLDELYAERAA